MTRAAMTFLLALLCIVGPSIALAAGSHSTSTDMLAMIKEIRETRDIEKRDELAYKLHVRFDDLSDAKAMDTVDDRAIDPLIGLLDDESDIVRGYAAEALGGFGLRAQRAVPSLERALRRQSEEDKRLPYPVWFGTDSIDYIVPALKSVQGIPQDVDYETGKKFLKDKKS
jgi:hypothetical protein